MDAQIVAIIIQEGGRIVSEYLRSQPHQSKTIHLTKVEEVAPISPTELQKPLKASEVATGCVPCSIGHLGTCSGLLNEAVRFANKDGMDSNEVIDRVNMCLDELNTMERVDLRPELITQLPDWEKELAHKALQASRGTRHQLESLKTTGDLEIVAAATQTIRSEVGRAWFKEKLRGMSPEDKEEINKRMMQKLEGKPVPEELWPR